MKSKSTNQSRKYDALQNARRAIVEAGVSNEAADAIMAAIHAALADVVTNDDLMQANKNLESTLKLYVGKISKEDRAYLIKHFGDEFKDLNKGIKDLRTDMAANERHREEREDKRAFANRLYWTSVVGAVGAIAATLFYLDHLFNIFG